MKYVIFYSYGFYTIVVWLSRAKWKLSLCKALCEDGALECCDEVDCMSLSNLAPHTIFLVVGAFELVVGVTVTVATRQG